MPKRSRKLTLERFLWDKWLPAIRPTVRTTTLHGYESHLRNHICPHIGAIRLDKVDGSMLNELYAMLLERGNQEGGPLSPATVRRVHVTLHRALRDAVRWDLIASNAAENADPPKLRIGHVELSTWSAEELRAFLDFAREDRLYPAWLLLATTGMRRGEVLGLRWCDLDLDRGELAVRQTVVCHHHGVSISPPKTAKGRRVVALDEITVKTLKAYEKEQGSRTQEDFLFHYETGNPISPSDVSKRFKRLVKRSKLRKIRLHDLRHTHATLALQAGIHPKIVSERLGHSTVSFTLDVYSHAIPHLQKEAASQIASLLFAHPQLSESQEP